MPFAYQDYHKASCNLKELAVMVFYKKILLAFVLTPDSDRLLVDKVSARY